MQIVKTLVGSAMNQVVLIITSTNYPDGDAGSVRVHSFAKLFRECGFYPIVVCLSKKSTYGIISYYDGISYISIRHGSGTILQRIIDRILFGFRIKRILNRIDYELVFTYGLTVNIHLQLKNEVSKKNKIFLVHDCVEWYSPNQFLFGRFSFSYINNNLINSKIIDENYKIVSISTFFENYYTAKNIKTTKIPVIVDLKSIAFTKKNITDKLVILYAGSLGRKDYFRLILDSINQLDPFARSKLELRIIGTSLLELSHNTGLSESSINNLQDVITIQSRVNRDAVLEAYKDAAFSIFIRDPSQRYSKAGFPTKLVESLATGTPIICNITSDLDTYLKDDENSLIVSNLDVQSMVSIFMKAISFSVEKIQVMSESARKTAEQYFDYRKYIDSFSNFLKSANDLTFGT